MGSRKQTAVNLTDSVQKIKDELFPIYGLKNILSAGLLLFSRLSAGDQKKVVAEVNQMSQADRQADKLLSSAEADSAKQQQKTGRKPSKTG